MIEKLTIDEAHKQSKELPVGGKFTFETTTKPKLAWFVKSTLNHRLNNPTRRFNISLEEGTNLITIERLE